MSNILQEKEVNFKDLERKIYEYGCKTASELLKECLQQLDGQLMNERDKSKYRHKGHRKTCIKTLMGEVEYSRAVYEITDEGAERKFVYLLDEYMGFDNIGFISSNLAEKIAEGICVGSYASTAKNITDLTGQSISHQGVWNVVQRLGEQVEKQENRYIELKKSADFHGSRETKVLFEEADGVFVKMQKRHSSKKDRKREIKLAISHEGWLKTGKNRYELAEKTVVCGMEKPGLFTKRKEAMIAKKYNTDEIDLRIFNSDGGGWIKALYSNDNSAQFQLDQFHLKKAIKDCGIGKEFESTIFSLLKEGKIEDTINYVEAVLNSVEEEKKIEKLTDLHKYLINNKSGLIPYQNRNLNLPKLNEGLVYRNMGNCEHNVYLTVASRMKHRSACWSPKGSLNLCKILCLKVSHTLKDTFETLSDVSLPENFTERITDILSAAKIPKTVGKGYVGRHCPLPFENVAVTNGRSVIREMLSLQ